MTQQCLAKFSHKDGLTKGSYTHTTDWTKARYTTTATVLPLFIYNTE